MPDGDPLFGMSMRQPPRNMEAEQALLGALLANNKAYVRVAEYLRPEHFADALHGRIYGEIGRRIAAGGLADAVSLRTWFLADPEADAAGGMSYLAQLLTAMVGIINAAEYGRAIFEAALRRDLIAAGETLVNDTYAGLPVDQLASAAGAALDRSLAAAVGPRGNATSCSLAEAVDAAVAAGDRARALGATSGLSTGLLALDEALGGMEPGALYVLAGRPGMGKTALGVQIAEAVARCGRGVLIVSLEMQASQLGRRVLSRLSGVPLTVLRKGVWNNAQAEAIVRARAEISDLPLTIEDQSSLNVQMIAAKARAAHRKHGLGLLVVDHLHIVATHADTTKMGATWAVGQVSNALKQLAKQMDIPVLALAQLNRGVEGRDDKRPSMSDLRQSGEIEQDAEAVMLLYRAEYYLSKAEPDHKPGMTAEKHADAVRLWRDQLDRCAGQAEVILPKVRDGEPGTVLLRFDGPRTAFMEPDYG